VHFGAVKREADGLHFGVGRRNLCFDIGGNLYYE